MKTYLLGKRIGAPEILLAPVKDIAPILAFPIFDWRMKIFPALRQSAPDHFADLEKIDRAFPGEGGIWNNTAAIHLAKMLGKVRWQFMLEPVRSGLIDFLAAAGGFEIRKEDGEPLMGVNKGREWVAQASCLRSSQPRWLCYIEESA